MILLNGKFEDVIGSDLIRDGMYLEVAPINNFAAAILEIFYSAVTNKFSITLFEENVALELVEESIKIAQKRLIPVQ